MNPYLARTIQRHPKLEPLAAKIQEAAELLARRSRENGTLLVCGNGGSAADGSHIVGELMKGFMHRRPPTADDIQKLEAQGDSDWKSLIPKLQRGIRAIALSDNSALGMAIANDLSPDLIFAQQVYAFGRPGDMLMGLSTSGNSKNVIEALRVARAFGIHTIGLTGERPGKMDPLCDILIKAPAIETPAIQEFHLPIYHAICAMTEMELFAE